MLTLLSESLGPAWPLLQRMGRVAAARGQRLALVGGPVRDLLLQRPVLDLDLVVEGPAWSLCRDMVETEGGQSWSFPAFGTSKWMPAQGPLIEVAMARRERYSRPGALPEVEPAGLEEDLGRRDFTLNAMAIELQPERLGRLIDPHEGRRDLEAGLLRSLHARSFLDDPTRLFRGARYAARYGLAWEPDTLQRAEEAWEGARGLGPERMGHELERCLAEPDLHALVQALEELRLWDCLGPGHLDKAGLAAELLELRRAAALEGVEAMELAWLALGRRLPPALRRPRLVPGDGHRQRIFTESPERVAEAGPALASEDPADWGRALSGLLPVERAAALVLAPVAAAWWRGGGRELSCAVKGDQLLALGLRGRSVGEALARARAAAWRGRSAEDQLRAALLDPVSAGQGPTQG